MDEYCERDRPPSARFVDIAAGHRHTCGLLVDGRVQCWGLTSSIHPYTGTASSHTASGFVAIDAHGGYIDRAYGGFMCALRAQQGIYCWGQERSFPLDASPEWQYPQPYDHGTFTALAVGASQICALDIRQRVKCWPARSFEDTPPVELPVRISDIAFAAIEAGAQHACGLRDDMGISCWGNNEAEQLDAPAHQSFVDLSAGEGHSCALNVEHSAVCWGDDSFGQSTPPADARFNALSAGELHTCGLELDGTALCWGSDIDGQASPPADIAFVEISAGAHHTCALTAAGEPHCWGSDAYGQATPPPAPASFVRLFTELSSQLANGPGVSCGLRDDGLAQCWGGSQDPSEPVLGGARLAEIAINSAYDPFACGLLVDGRVSCWHFSPEWADPDLDAVIAGPAGDVRFSSVAIVGRRACGLTHEGALHCWGADTTSWGDVAPPPPPGEHIDLTSREHYGCSIDSEGAIWCWSDGHPLAPDLAQFAHGGRGLASVGERSRSGSTPKANYRALTLGNSTWHPTEGVDRILVHMCALSEDGTVVCWGSNEFGQASPPSGVRFIGVTAGARHTCGIAADGTARCWGANDAGQSTPPVDDVFVELIADHDSTCGLRRGGAVVCWGDHPLSAPPQLDPFDIALPDLHSTDIKQLDRLGIIGGTECSTQRFCTDAPITHATLSVWLDRLLTQVAPGFGTNEASAASGDVQGDLWWAPHARRLASTGVMKPCDADRHDRCAHDEITRDEIEQILTAALETHALTDATAVARAATMNTLALVRADVLSSCIDRSPDICHHGAVSRGQAATVLNRWRQHVAQLAPPAFTSISADDNGGCGRRANGTVECWGEDDSGATYVASDDRVLEVRYYGTHWCGTTVSRRTVCRGWDGYNHGRVRDVFTPMGDRRSGFCAQQSDAGRRCWSSGSFRRSLGLDAGFIEVSANEWWTCGRRIDGSVQCWGDPPGMHPDQSFTDQSFTSVTTASSFACGRIADGSRQCWTLDVDAEVPDVVATGDFAHLSDSGYHSCAIKPDGSVACWGRDDSGEATPPPGSISYTQVAAGAVWEFGHACGLRADGTVDCWGNNSLGQSDAPDGDDFTRVAASGVHACGLRSDGKIECWGQRLRRGEGPSQAHRYVDVVVGAGGSFGDPQLDDERRGLHAAHICALRIDGVIECWGSQYTPNKPYNRHTPDPDSRFTSMSSGRDHVCGVRSDGVIECWGMPAFIAY